MPLSGVRVVDLTRILAGPFCSMNALVSERIRENTVDHWIEHLNHAGVPCGRVADLKAVFADPQVLAQEMLLEVEHPGHGRVRMTGFPVKLSATPCRVRMPAPELGADTEAVLRELGLESEISRLREKRVI